MPNKPKPLTLAQIGDTKKPKPVSVQHPSQNLGKWLHPTRKGR